MNKFFSTIILFLLVSFSALPQESSFYDAPFGGGIGYIGGWIFPKVYGINSELQNFGVSKFPTTGFYTSGGTGFIYLGIIKNFRIGGVGFGGSFSTSGNSKEVFPPGIYGAPSKIVPVNNEAVYSLNGGGITIEYTIPYVRDFGISIGALIGKGSLNIELYRNVGSKSWQSYWNDASKYPSTNFSSTLLDNYWIFTPMLNIDIPAYHLLCFRIGAGYQITFGSKWTYDNNQDLTDAPTTVNGNSFYIQAGVLVGIFSF